MSAEIHSNTTSRAYPVRVAKKRYVGHLVKSLFFASAFAFVIYLFATSPHIRWGVFGSYVFYSTVMSGLLVTLQLTVLCMVLGTVLGVVLALMRISSDPVLQAISGLYVWIWRGTPVLVQLILMFNLALLIPRIGFGDYSVATNTVMTPFIAAVIAFTLNEAAYMAEIIRGGILSVDEGQMEAAQAQGFTRKQAMRLIVLPQTITAVLPVTGNQTIGLLKATSLVSVIAAQDLMTAVEHVYQRNYLVIELLFVACFWYLIIVSVASVLQHYLEQWVASKRGQEFEPDILQRALAAVRSRFVATRSVTQ